MSDRSPQTILVKRKRTDEPVETLYIQDPDQKRRLTGNDYYFKRVSDKPKAVPSLLVHSASAPNISEIASSGPKPGSPAKPGSKAMGSLLSVPQIARRFHLSRSATSTPTGASSPGSLKRKLETPVFYERVKRPASEYGSPSRSPLLRPSSGEPLTDTESPEKKPPRKRPGATAAEKRWREKHWNEANEAAPQVAEPAPKDGAVAIERFFALADELDAADSTASGGAQRLPMRYKPKVPIRRKDRVPGPKTEAMEIEVPDESDLVTDMYIRVPLPGDHDVDMNSNLVGLLVIDEPEQDFWDSWIEGGEPADSDKEFETDEEDENAEDYYAADYPEDEVASDDEYGRNPHQYQHDASDQEESDDDGAFSDEEDLQRPWKRHPWK